MTRLVSYARLFSSSIVFGVWAVVRACGVYGDFVNGAFLMLVAVTLVVAECERHRLRQEERR